MNKSFLSCDWGTSSFRLRLIDAVSGKAIDESVSDEGISRVYEAWVKTEHKENSRTAFYLSVVDRHIKKIKQQVKDVEQDLPVIISGMASSNIGIMELPYTMLPFVANGKNLAIKRTGKEDFFNHDLIIISGARTQEDVMRGEETQLAGCANGDMHGKQLFIFPGTHSKHVTTVADQATDIKTYMTGEFFNLLAEHSILKSSVEADMSNNNEKENNAAFEAGVKNGSGNNLLHAVFMVRTNQLLKRFSREANYHYLSGLLIGAELSGLLKTETDTMTLVGEETLMNKYLLAFTILGIKVPIKKVDAATATVRGHLAIYRNLYQ